MIELSKTNRSFIAHLQPGQRIAYTDRDGKTRTVHLDPDRPAAGWLHLFHHNEGIVKAWFGSPTLLQNNIPITDRQPVSNALEALLLSCQDSHAALVGWELKQHTTRAGAPYGEPVWIPANYTLVPIEQKEISDAL